MWPRHEWESVRVQPELFRSIAVAAGGTPAWTAILSGARESGAIAGAAGSRRSLPHADRYRCPSYAPADPVDCTDPNNVINCQTLRSTLPGRRNR